jgi:predicted transcriptional regulator
MPKTRGKQQGRYLSTYVEHEYEARLDKLCKALGVSPYKFAQAAIEEKIKREERKIAKGGK